MSHIPVYAGLTMRKLLTLFFLAALASTVGGPTSPTLHLDSCTFDGTDCAVGQAFTLAGEGYKPGNRYVIVADDGVTVVGPEQLIAASDGTIMATLVAGVADARAWTFTIYPENHNATPNLHRDLQSVQITFD